VLADDPLLTARTPAAAPRQLLRVVLSNTLKIPLTSRLARTAIQTPVIVYSSRASLRDRGEDAEKLRGAGVEIVALPDQEGHFSFTEVLRDLHRRRVTNLLVEPGPTLARNLLQRGQVDRVWVFRSPMELHDATGLAISSAPTPAYPATGSVDLAGDLLTEYLNPSSAVYFASVASADLVTASATG
jgi:diaminohydroxyphosphoribosylaminopyrimidine deaminase/5-amino-6-(5-phosphoribosylamino)uracil reductase